MPEPAKLEVLIDSGLPILQPLPFCPFGSTLSVFDGTILVCGGASNGNNCYSYSNGFWAFHSKMNRSRRYHSAVSTKNCLYVFGGHDSISGQDTFEYLPVGSTQWQLGQGFLPGGGFVNGSATSINSGKEILLIGGLSYETSIVKFDVASHTFCGLSAVCLQSKRMGHSCAILPSGEILITGGCWRSNFYETTEILDPNSWTIRRGPPMTFKRRAHGMGVVTYDGSPRVVVLGGYDGRRWLSSVEEYDGLNGVWRPSKMKLRRPSNGLGCVTYQNKDLSFDVVLE